MPYGRPSSSGHGRRATRYHWVPSFVPSSARRKPRRAALRPARQRRTRLPLPDWDWVAAFASAPSGRGIPNWYFNLVGSLLLLALAIHFPPFLVLCVFRWVMEGTRGYENEANKSILSTVDEKNKAILIKRKTSVEAPPTPEAVRAAWGAARRSLAGKLLAGTLLSNLEPVVDQSYIRDADGTVIGRRPGIKGWLAANCPDMLPHYKALMSYKALADKLRMALGVKEPDTLSGVLDFGTKTLDVTDDGARAAPKTAGTVSETAAKGAKKTAGRRGISPKSLQIRNGVRLLKSNVENVIRNIDTINDAMSRSGDGGTMKALEEAVRERLGLVWMRRGRRRRLAA